MQNVVPQRFEQIARSLLPILTVFLFVLAGAAAWPLPYVGSVVPSLGLVAVFYWAIHRPDLLRPSAVFMLGLLNDAIHFLPLGLTALLFVALHQLVYAQRRFFAGQFFLMLWFGFAVVALIATGVTWVVKSVYNGQVVTFMPVFLQFVLTTLFFPLPAWILIRLQRAFLTQR